ncbi:sulfate ABC transporter substrate-binding protein [Neisseria animalis]|uniref:Sulfate ABC transporter substrate-binding protein n=1 Tax=Neisseria animalis TaxID=492 RepID=A0A5P3MT76_NEIAN|nr:sulfate ABC transporter substrate-binding protein [Neisseria animalis]QEY24728.1 sulfate ABC transporter substrate-binding protein [Neisseria animalis]ROW31678.1 sulfate ABC transporter substrate-binding protein [Neisseria animalis]VEE07845.1 sulfate-binding protein [Neisseria animalis]
MSKTLCWALGFAAALTLAAACSRTQATADAGEYMKILNVSYDVSRDFYKEYNPLFVREFKKIRPDIDLHIQQSHGGSSKQAMSVANGLPADVVTMNQTSDIDTLAQRGLVASDWADSLPNQAVPFSSATVFLVRKGNPKDITDWHVLADSDVKVVFANPKTSGNGRYAFLSLYGYALKTYGSQTEAETFTRKVLANVPMFENGSRAASTSFTQREIGDVLVTLENEANFISRNLLPDQFEIVYPSYTAEAESPVAVVESVTAKKGTREAARAYLQYLWSDPAQELAAKMYFRPGNAEILARHRTDFPKLNTFRPNETLGSWPEIMTNFFADGGIFDRLNTR